MPRTVLALSQDGAFHPLSNLEDSAACPVLSRYETGTTVALESVPTATTMEVLPIRYVEIPNEHPPFRLSTAISESLDNLEHPKRLSPSLSSTFTESRLTTISQGSLCVKPASLGGITSAGGFRLKPRPRGIFAIHPQDELPTQGSAPCTGRKRSAFTMNSIPPRGGDSVCLLKSYAGSSDTGESTPAKAHFHRKDFQAPHEPSFLAITPFSPMTPSDRLERVEIHECTSNEMFGLQGLSIQSPVGSGASSHCNSSTSLLNCSTPARTSHLPSTGIPEGAAVNFSPVALASSPAASFASTSSCFSKVDNAASTAAATDYVSHRWYRSSSFGSSLGDHRSTMSLHHTVSHNRNSASPKLVPLTVLPPAPQNNQCGTMVTKSFLSPSRSKQNQNRRSDQVPPSQPSPLMRSLNGCSSSSTSSGFSPSTNSIRVGIQNEGHLHATPNRPPLSMVRCSHPESVITTSSWYSYHDTTPITAPSFAQHAALQETKVNFEESSPMKLMFSGTLATKRSAKGTPVPKIALTPRRSAVSSLPCFPSPTEHCGTERNKSIPGVDMISPIVFPKRSMIRPNGAPILNLSLPSVLDVSLLSEPCHDETNSLDLSPDHFPSSESTDGTVFHTPPTPTGSFLPFPRQDTTYRQRRNGGMTGIQGNGGTAPSSCQDWKVALPSTASTMSESACSQFLKNSLEKDERIPGFCRNAEDESLSDDDEDEQFFLAVPTTNAEENGCGGQLSDPPMRQTKFPRLHFGSMTSLASGTSLFGINFAFSSNSLQGMAPDLTEQCNILSTNNGSSGQKPCGMTEPHDRAQHMAMRRDKSSASIGLALEQFLTSATNLHSEKNCIDVNSNSALSIARDLVTSPISLQVPYSKFPINDILQGEKDSSKTQQLQDDVSGDSTVNSVRQAIG